MEGAAMQQGLMRRSTRTVGWWAKMVAFLGAGVLVMWGLAATSASAAGTVWLCKPGLANNPCESDLTATVEFGNGFSFVNKHDRPASNPPIDCFYVYPTVSSQIAINANLNIDPEETAIAFSQASHFSQVCKVYAPIYPQLTLFALNFKLVTPEAAKTAYEGVLSAWQDYLANFNHGRGVVLIGHSQGAALLIQLLKEQIDPNPSLRKQLVSAVVLGANVIVPAGHDVGGSFQNIPACETVWQRHCVVAYSSFLNEPPNPSNFARAQSALFNPTGVVPGVTNPQVLCVNPTVLVQGNHAGPAFSYYPTFNPPFTPPGKFPGFLGPFVQVPKAPTPWVATPGQYSAQCKQNNGASWLQVTNVGPPGDPREQLTETLLGSLWGTHLADVNLTLGNLVGEVGLQGLVYQFLH